MFIAEPDPGHGRAVSVTTSFGESERDEAEAQAGVDAAPETPVPEPTPEPPPPPSDAPITRLRIQGIGIDANVIVLGVDGEGVMQAPKTATDIAWYDFSARPGFGSNAVFAAHVDFAGVGPAVFWRLRELSEGAEIEVRLEDGTSYQYRVVFSRTYSANEAPIEEIIGATGLDSITLITCDGTFNTRTREYDRRLVVRAERLV
jgi:LPXTG-site transpeptidase (sortase) family protein